VDEAEGGWLTYQYDPQGNLTTTTDALGQTTTLKYDLMGRKVYMNDPSMGEWRYGYNSFDELRWQTDAKGQTTRMVYDVLGRMVERHEAEGVSRWVYDTAPHGLGKLAAVTGPNSYRKAYQYDQHGRAVKEILTGVGLGAEGGITQYAYDGASRVKDTVHPNGLQVNNVYNARGYLTAVRSPRSHISDYDLANLESRLQQTLDAAGQVMRQYFVYLDQATYYRNHMHAKGLRLKWANQLKASATRLKAIAASYQRLANRAKANAAYQNSLYDYYALKMSRLSSRRYHRTKKRYYKKLMAQQLSRARSQLALAARYQQTANSLQWQGNVKSNQAASHEWWAGAHQRAANYWLYHSRLMVQNSQASLAKAHRYYAQMEAAIAEYRAQANLLGTSINDTSSGFFT